MSERNSFLDSVVDRTLDNWRSLRGAWRDIAAQARGVLSGAPGTANGTTPGLRTNVYGLRAGAFSPGIPRSVQFGLRVNF
jgi:hypothetical protein